MQTQQATCNDTVSMCRYYGTCSTGGDSEVAIEVAPLALHVAHEQVRGWQEVDGALVQPQAP